MITLYYFAKLRETLNCDSEELPWQAEFTHIAKLQLYLSKRNSAWRQLLDENTILVAVNQQMADANTSIKDGDEIAFFPPVTGG